MFELLQICEGDHTRWIFPNFDLRSAAVDRCLMLGRSWGYVLADIESGETTQDGWRGGYRSSAVET